MRLRRFAFLSTILTIGIAAAGIGHAQGTVHCLEAERTLKGRLRSTPDRAVGILGRSIQSNESCVAQLVFSAIEETGADGALVGDLVAEAIRRVPHQVVAIAESALAAAPSSSDVVASVVHQLLGDCDAIGEELGTRIASEPEKALMFVEDALRAHENCACEIVRAAVHWAAEDEAVIRRIVATAVAIAPIKAADITECATAEAPGAGAAIQAGLEEVLDAMPVSGPGNEDDGDEATTAAQSLADSSYGKGNGERAHGKNTKDEAATEGKSKRDWRDWPEGLAPPSPALYWLAPSGGPIRDVGALAPMSPTNPRMDEPYPRE